MSTINKPAVEPDADSFRVGDWWLSPRGTRFLVIERIGWKVSMRAGGTGRKQWRVWDDIGAHMGRQWIRESWGGAS